MVVRSVVGLTAAAVTSPEEPSTDCGDGTLKRKLWQFLGWREEQITNRCVQIKIVEIDEFVRCLCDNARPSTKCTHLSLAQRRIASCTIGWIDMLERRRSNCRCEGINIRYHSVDHHLDFTRCS